MFPPHDFVHFEEDKGRYEVMALIEALFTRGQMARKRMGLEPILRDVRDIIPCEQ